jgi:hypothetical protein
MSPFLRRCAALFRRGQDVEQAWDGPESTAGQPKFDGISTGFWQKVLRSIAIWSQPRKLVLIWPIGASQWMIDGSRLRRRIKNLLDTSVVVAPFAWTY